MLLGEDAVGRHRVVVTALEALGEPVVDRIRHRVAREADRTARAERGWRVRIAEDDRRRGSAGCLTGP
jgi:hypothetical protein